MVAIGLRCLHTSKRMHFIEDPPFGPSRLAAVFLHTSKRMHFIEELMIFWFAPSRPPTCIRQNVCTSLRSTKSCPLLSGGILHTSKRMHFIEDRSGGQSVRGP